MSKEYSNGPTGGYTTGTTNLHTTSNYTLQMNRTASWCPNCGRKRGPDGRCPDCDPWWTTPVVQYAGALGVMVTLLLLGGVALLQPHGTSGIVRAVPGDTAGVAPTFSGGSPAAPMGYTAPVYRAPVYTPPVMSAINMATIAPSPQQWQWQAIEQLRQMTAYTDSIVEQQRQVRWEQQRTVYQTGSPANSAAETRFAPVQAPEAATTY